MFCVTWLFTHIELLEYRRFYRRRDPPGYSMKLESYDIRRIRSFLCIVNGYEYPHGEYARPKKIIAESFIHSFMSPQRRILGGHFYLSQSDSILRTPLNRSLLLCRIFERRLNATGNIRKSCIHFISYNIFVQFLYNFFSKKDYYCSTLIVNA